MAKAQATTRTCKKCGRTFPLETGFPSLKGKFGILYRHECRECNAARVETWHGQHREERLGQNREYYQRVAKPRMQREEWRVVHRQKMRDLNTALRLQVIHGYNGKCACCGEDEPRFLTVDHVNGDGKAHRKRVRIGRDLYRWIIANDYPPSLQVLCFNCNLGRAHNKGICPHRIQ